jgi:hypothetical protein
MDAKPKVLFLLFEGLAATVVESQVLANVRMLQNRRVADFEVWAFACLGPLLRSSRSRQANAEKLAQAPVHVFRGMRPLSLLAYLANVLLLAWHLFPVRHRFTHIHARTDYSAAVAGPLAKLFGLKLVWDCRGDSAAEVEERFQGRKGPMRALVWLRIRELAFYSWMAGRSCSSALFVTDELLRLHRRLIGDKPAEVIPCAAHEDLFFYDPALRATMRQRLGYGDQNTVYVYSGSLTAYQCFAETVALFDSVYSHATDSRFLVLTPAVEEAKRALAHLPQCAWQAHTCSLSEVNGYLNAADVGFLMRQHSRTNLVAFPTKFAEYGLTGLGVVTTDALPAVFRIATSIGNLASVADGKAVLPHQDRTEIAHRFSGEVGRSGFVGAYLRTYAGVS